MNEAKQLGKVLKSLKETAASAGTSEGNADLQVLAIMNPLTRVAQRMSQVSSGVQCFYIIAALWMHRSIADVSCKHTKSLERAALQAAD